MRIATVIIASVFFAFAGGQAADFAGRRNPLFASAVTLLAGLIIAAFVVLL